jgi:hypothetical protein
MKALEKRPEDRYADAAAMRDDLLAFAEGRSVAGRPVSLARHRLRLLRGRWKPLAISAAGLRAAVYLFLTFFPATLAIRTYPVAEVFLGEESLGTTPLETSVRPGRYRLVLRSQGFRDWVDEVRLRPGGTWSFERTLIADPGDPEARAVLARRYGLPTIELAAVERTRGADDDDWIEPISPRGKVRREEVDALRIDVGEAWDDAGRLEVRRGSEVLHTEDFAPIALSTTRLLPELAAALRPGDEFEWGFYPEQGEPRVVRCTLATVPSGIARMEQDLADQDPAVRGHLRALAFLREGLFLAALDEATGLLQFDRPDPRVLAVIQQALLGAGLERTRYGHTWDELVDLAGTQGK